MMNMSGWWAAKLRVLCCETKKEGKKVKKQNKREQKQKTNVSRVGRDFFVICNWDSAQILTLDAKKQQSVSVAKPRLLYASLNQCL